MSVVNKMLQDLENRQPNGSDANYVPPQKGERTMEIRCSCPCGWDRQYDALAASN